MRNLILVVAILQLATVVIGVDEFQFGDLIAFPRKISCGCKSFTYNHYAVYVGDKEFDGKKPGENIFHHTGSDQNTILANCVFGTIKAAQKHVKDNFLDDKGYTPAPEHLMIEHIKSKHKNCGKYHPFSNNCEHLATYVRYGVPISLQLDQTAAKYCKNGRNHDIEGTEEILKQIAALEDPDKACDVICPKGSSGKNR